LKTKVAERALWEKVSVQMIYGDSPGGPRTDYADQEPEPAIYARGEPADVQLEVSRGIDYQLADILVEVALEIKNVDKDRRTARRVVLTETLPADLEYVWNSARLNGRRLREVAGANPYRFNVGDMRPGDELLLTYGAFRRKIMMR
jgi:hypothetical protein